MTYEETLSHIYGRGRFGIKHGLERVSALLHILGNPQEHVTTVQVAGTNGKGSTCAFLAAMLAASGLKTGLFTSPHLTRFTERIRVAGREIDEADVVRLAELVLDASPTATFFEIATALALLHFAGERVDLAVMEVGMGGRYDATSVAPGVVSVITPIGLDHCDYLGSDVATIAAEKAGIIRGCRPVISAPQPAEAMAVIRSRCQELGSPLYVCGEDFSADWEGSVLRYRGLGIGLADLKPGIGGRYQAVNAACALAAAELLAHAGFSLPGETLARGIAAATWPGRMEVVGEDPRVLLDGAHNPAAADALVCALADVPYDRLVLVLGVMGDKDLDGIVGPLLPLASRVIAVSPALERALPAEDLARFCRDRGAPSEVGGTVAEGLTLARSLAGPADLVLVTGSLFTVGEARASLFGSSYEPFRG